MSNHATVSLGIIDLENLTVNLKPKAPEPGNNPVGLGTPDAPFGDLFLQGNTLTLSTKSIGITERDGVEYLDFGANVMIGSTTITGTRLLAFGDQLKISSLTDVSIEGIANGDILNWDKDTSTWVAGSILTPTNLDISQKNIGELEDVAASVYADGMMWQYNESLSSWKAVNTNLLEFEDFQVKGTFTVNSDMMFSTSRTLAVTAGEVVADTFNINTFRSAKYIVTCEDYTLGTTAYWTGEIALVHDGTDTEHVIYGDVELGAISIEPEIAADILATDVRLKVTTSSDQQVITVHRTVCTNYGGTLWAP
jgi:hypothetical protein|tara:strand:+ start:15397 stop:16323 length:927 start_codon:yes stop_codon:yes gene_type:complete